MYAKGIRKVFTAHDAGMNLSTACQLAANARYNAMSFNGVIYIRSKASGIPVWYETVLEIDDFEC